MLDTRDGTGRPARRPVRRQARRSICRSAAPTAFNPTTADVVPDTPNVTGVLLNVVGITAAPGGASTFVSRAPGSRAGRSEPATSNLNLAAGVIKANLVFVPVGADGKVRIYNSNGNDRRRRRRGRLHARAARPTDHASGASCR